MSRRKLPSAKPSIHSEARLRLVKTFNRDRSHKWNGKRLDRLRKLSGLTVAEFAAYVDLRTWQVRAMLENHTIRGPLAILCNQWEESYFASIGYVSLCPALNPIGVQMQTLKALGKIARGETDDPQKAAQEVLTLLSDGKLQGT